jgi:hypothetical protein
LLRLTRAERQALFAEESAKLADLARCKERMFGELASYQHSRQELLKYLLGPQGSRQDYLKCPAMQAILESFTPEESDCLFHINAGIDMLVIQLDDLVRGNFALADCAMKRAWALQTWLQVASQTSQSTPMNEVNATRNLLEAGSLTTQISA